MKTLKKFKQFVNEITAENGRLYKESILEKYKEDEDIKQYLNFIYNPYIITGISDKKYNKEINEHHFVGNFPVLDFIYAFSKYNFTGKDNDIGLLHDYRDFHISEDLKPLFKLIITKNLQLGIDAKSINKIIPGLIPQFSVQLANKYFDKLEVVEGKEFAITTKIDGMRCIMLKENGNVTFWSRQGQPIEGLVDLEEEAKKYIPDTVCLDGELIADVNSSDTYKDTMKRARTKDVEKHGLKMMVFDYMTVDEFKNQCANNAYHKRRDLLDCVFNGTWFIHDFKYFEELPILYQGRDTTKIIELLEEQTSKGEEGIMLNLVNAPYIFGRTNNLLKVKKFQDTEVTIIGFEEGINKNTGMLGALICDYKGNQLGVGSGLSDELRIEIWNNKEKYLGKVITVKYFEETKSESTDLPSLRFPIFLRFREDL